MTKVRALFFLLLFCAASALAAAPETRFAVWSEFLPYSEVQALLPSLAAHQTALYLAVPETNTDWDGLVALMNRAAILGVEVKPWLLLDQSHGYWFNKWNLGDSEAWVWRFLDEMKNRGGIRPEWLIFDIEPPADLVARMQALFAKGDLWGVRNLLEESSKSASIRAAGRAYRSLLKQLHEKGVRVHAVAANFILDDKKDGKLRIQSALGTPIDGIPWDEISFMVYRPELKKFMGSIGPDIVFDYSKRARALYGDRTAIALGEIGAIHYPQPATGYTAIGDLQADYSAALKAGITRFEFYSLDGMAGSSGEGLDFWLDSLHPEPESRWDLQAAIWLGLVDFARGFLPDGK